MGGFSGIPLPAIHSLFQIKRIPRIQQSDLLDDIQTIEAGALKVLNTQDE